MLAHVICTEVWKLHALKAQPQIRPPAKGSNSAKPPQTFPSRSVSLKLSAWRNREEWTLPEGRKQREKCPPPPSTPSSNMVKHPQPHRAGWTYVHPRGRKCQEARKTGLRPSHPTTPLLKKGQEIVNCWERVSHVNSKSRKGKEQN